MSKINRNSEIINFIESLRGLRHKEAEMAIIIGNHLNEQFNDLTDKGRLNTEEDVFGELLYKLMEKSDREKNVTFTNAQLSCFHSTVFHLGSVHIIESIIKEMGAYFDLDIPERKKMACDMNAYDIKDVDTLDYSNIQRKFMLIIGGVSDGYSDETHKKCTQACLDVLEKYLDKNEIERNPKGFIIQTALQNIPDITRELVASNLGVYGIIPVQEKESSDSHI